jgi:adenine-specific DNA methylase
MKCPHCGKEISDKEIARHLAKKGGKKSRRVLTKEQAQEMNRIKKAKRKK